MITAKEIVLSILEEFENKTFVFKPVINKLEPGYFLALIINLDGVPEASMSAVDKAAPPRVSRRPTGSLRGVEMYSGCGWDSQAKRVIEFKHLKKLGTIEISERTREQTLPGSNGAYIAGINFYSFDIDLHTSQGLEQLRSYLIKQCSYQGIIIEYEEELNESNLSTMRQ